jgi:acetoin utilization deacetylase AcuC-like enzyme
MAKYRLLRERIASSGMDVELLIPPAATDEQLLLVHSAEYLDKIKTGRLSALEQRRIGFPWSEKMVERSRRSTGATIAAGFAAAEHGMAFNLAGGTHHAFADSGQGYCVFNDTCVAARALQNCNAITTALIVDCDVHQGNGTAAITNQDPSLYAFSMHCSKNFPFQKTDGDLDAALPPGTGDAVYLRHLEGALEQIGSQFTPDIVFYLAGADPFEDDRLGQLGLTQQGLLERDKLVYDYFRNRSIPVATCMAGGYADDINKIVDLHFATVEAAAARFHTDQIF